MFRKLARPTRAFDVSWGDDLDVLPWLEGKSQEIGQFLYGTGSKSFAACSECSDGTVASAVHYVTRAIEYMRDKPDCELGLAASSLVYDKRSGDLIAVCLCCGASVYHIEVDPAYQNQGIATRMLKRALTVCAERGAPELHLWRNDDSPGAKLYEELGFVPTGEVE
jgi:GNAT superfamily N-acetyltransferase